MSIGSLIGNVAASGISGTLAVGLGSIGINNYLTIIPAGKIDTIDVMATLEETHVSTLVITDHPIERGAEITDHSYMRPVELTMRCGWSNSNAQATNDLLNGGLSAAVSLLQGNTSQLSSLFADGNAPYGDFSSTTYQKLMALQASGNVIDVVTSVRKYSDMLISNISLTRNKNTANALIVTIEMRQVFFVSTSSSTLPDAANMATPADTQPVIATGTTALAPTVQSLHFEPIT